MLKLFLEKLPIFSTVSWEEVDGIYHQLYTSYYSYFIIIDQNVSFLMKQVFNNSLCFSSTLCIYQFLILNTLFSFPADFFTYQLDFSLFWPLNLLSPSILFPSFFLFHILFQTMWMLAVVNKLKHMGRTHGMS